MTAIKSYEVEELAGALVYYGNTWILLDCNNEVITTSVECEERRLLEISYNAPDPMTWAQNIAVDIARAIRKGHGEPITTLPEEVAEYAHEWGWPVEAHAAPRPPRGE